MLFRRVFAITSAALVLFIFNSCDLLSTIDLLNEACKVSRYTNTHAGLLHHDSTLFLRVHVHVRLFFIILMRYLLDPSYTIPASTHEIISARRSTDRKVLLQHLPSSRHARLQHTRGAGKIHQEQALIRLSFHQFWYPPRHSQTVSSPWTQKSTLYSL